MRPLLNIAIRVVRQAAQLILKSSQDSVFSDPSWTKRIQAAKNIKRKVGAQMRDMILYSYPKHAIGVEALREPEEFVIWLLNPLEGLENFIRGDRDFGLSVAILEQRRPVLSVVYAPLQDALLFAERGGGARCNDHRLRLERLEHAPSACWSVHTHLKEGLSLLHLQTKDRIRMSGSLLVDYVHLLMNRVDACFEDTLDQTSRAAALLLVEEAGGIILSGEGIPVLWNADSALVSGHPQFLNHAFRRGLKSY